MRVDAAELANVDSGIGGGVVEHPRRGVRWEENRGVGELGQGISLAGVYGGMTDRWPMMVLFDKQIQLRMGQANIKRWVDDIMPLLLDDDDPLGTEQFATHRVSLDDAPTAYRNFQKKQDGTVKVVFKPGSGRP